MLTVRPRPAGRALAVAALIALGAAGCGSGDDAPSRSTTTTTASAAASAPTATETTPAPATTGTTAEAGGTVPVTGDGGAFRSVLPSGWASELASRNDLPEGAAYFRERPAASSDGGIGDVLAVLPGPREPGGIEEQARSLGSGSQLPPVAYAGRTRTTVDGEPAVVLSFPITEGGREMRQTMVLVSHARRSYVVTFATGGDGSARVPDVVRRFLAAWRWR